MPVIIIAGVGVLEVIPSSFCSRNNIRRGDTQSRGALLRLVLINLVTDISNINK